MKKLLVLLALCAMLILSACQTKAPVNQSAKNANGTPAVNLPANNTPLGPELAGQVIEIKEKMFITQTNDIYTNSEDYLGKTIKYEGIFTTYAVPDSDAVYYSVIRYGPGCCGNDSNAGFEVVWDKEYPNENDWVEAVGVLEQYEENNCVYIRLRLSSLNVLPVRGVEKVSR
ncbi:MAG: hypothetical protein LBS74_06400 [Oscillospiraceae bacterium]|jgi:uncharacterized membrane protein YcgQ (UPF0703/DUF1980 family)|nr:hypothetical protein [Oscillospiraceae bacterium]